jgi:hypothetical protein
MYQWLPGKGRNKTARVPREVMTLTSGWFLSFHPFLCYECDDSWLGGGGGAAQHSRPFNFTGVTTIAPAIVVVLRYFNVGRPRLNMH